LLFNQDLNISGCNLREICKFATKVKREVTPRRRIKNRKDTNNLAFRRDQR